MSVTGNAAERVRKCRKRKAKQDLERIEITLGEDLSDRLREDAECQRIPLPRLIAAILADHLHSEKKAPARARWFLRQ